MCDSFDPSIRGCWTARLPSIRNAPTPSFRSFSLVYSASSWHAATISVLSSRSIPAMPHVTRLAGLLWALLGGDPACFGAPDTGDALAFVESYCIDCHAAVEPAAGFDLEALTSPENHHGSALSTASTVSWERVLKRVRARQMPPPDVSKPSDEEYASAVDGDRIDARRVRRREPSSGAHGIGPPAQSHRIHERRARPACRRRRGPFRYCPVTKKGMASTTSPLVA